MLATKPETKRFNFNIDQSTYEFLTSAAKEKEMSASELIRELINDYKLKKNEILLKEAALTLMEEYSENRDLLSFTTLDGEDFL